MSKDKFDVKVIGIENVLAAFNEIPEDVQNRVLRKAYVRAGKYFKKQLEDTISTSGVDVKSIGRMNYSQGLFASGGAYSDNLLSGVTGKFHKGKGFDPSLFKVSIMGVHKTGSGTFRLRFFENGTKERVQQRVSKKGKPFTFKVGRIPAKHWMANTLANSSAETESIAEQVIMEEIEKYNAKLNR